MGYISLFQDGVLRNLALENIPEPSFSEMIRRIEHDLLEMSSRSELMFQRSVDALKRIDGELAEEVIASDSKVDTIDRRIETQCLVLLRDSAASSSDILLLGTVLKLITDIERVADLAVDISQCVAGIEGELGATGAVDLHSISEIARAMFHLSIEAYVRRDSVAVTKVLELENQVDEMFREMKTQIYDRMRTAEESPVALSHLLIALHDIERVADHAVNIAERVQNLIDQVGADISPVK